MVPTRVHPQLRLWRATCREYKLRPRHDWGERYVWHRKQSSLLALHDLTSGGTHVSSYDHSTHGSSYRVSDLSAYPSSHVFVSSYRASDLSAYRGSYGNTHVSSYRASDLRANSK